MCYGCQARVSLLAFVPPGLEAAPIRRIVAGQRKVIYQKWDIIPYAGFYHMPAAVAVTSDVVSVGEAQCCNPSPGYHIL